MHHQIMFEPVLIKPAWPAPENIVAYTTTRLGGESRGGFAGFNLALHVGDEPQSVMRNRQRLAEFVGIEEGRFAWLNQVHGTRLVQADNSASPPEADGVFTSEASLACVVMTADCLPVLLCDREGEQVMAVHAGWRGLAAGILQQAVARYPQPENIMVWLGPAIGPENFQVGEDVYAAFTDLNSDNSAAFVADDRVSDRWLADIYQLARNQLSSVGVTQIYGGNDCTYKEVDRFYSFRRDGAASGRMATFIYKHRPQ